MDKDGDAVSQPLDNLQSLLKWQQPKFKDCCLENSHEQHKNDKFMQRRSRNDDNQPKVLVCHDMAGGYLEDRYIQGCPQTGKAYNFYHWQLIDLFVYFSHHFVTIPPLGWIIAGHKHGVPVLGTVITEWNEGANICKQMLESHERVDEVTTKLAEIASFFGFDGWLVNIENVVESMQIPLLRTFVQQLTEKCHAKLQNGTVIWYDSVTDKGKLQWQDEINTSNEMFFDVCDGIFLNYCITEEKLSRSREKSSQSHRQKDVYVGIDVFGRGTPGGGGFNCREVVEMITKEGLSCAFFAPGWVMEYLGPEDFYENNILFWGLLSDLLSTRPLTLPFSTYFCQGQGEKYFLHDKIVSDSPWFNLSLQSIQPSYTQSQFMSYAITKKLVESVKEEENVAQQASNKTELKVDNNCSVEAKKETSIGVKIEENQDVKALGPKMFFDLSRGFKGGGSLCLQAQAVRGCPAFFKLFSITGAKKLAQLTITLEQSHKSCLALFMSPKSVDATLENASVIFEPLGQHLASDCFSGRSSQALVIHSQQEDNSRPWITRTYEVDLNKPEMEEDMNLSALLYPADEELNEQLCVWLGGIQAVTERNSKQVQPLDAGPLKCLEIWTQSSLAEANIKSILHKNFWKSRYVDSTKQSSEVTTEKQRTSVDSLLSSLGPETVSVSLMSPNTETDKPSSFTPLLREKLDLTQDTHIDNKTENRFIYLLQWELSSPDIDHFLVYLVNNDQSKTFLGFTSTNCFVYHTQTAVKDLSFCIQPVLSF